MVDRLQLPLADVSRQQLAQETFPYREQTPEEYAARSAHLWGSFSFDDFRYSDPVLDAWIARLGDIFFQRPGAPSLQSLRERLLTPAERKAIELDSEL